jgi:uncharacterized protein DUF3891
MVIFPIVDESSTPEPISAWQEVQARQMARAPSYWVATQPSHAVLAGDLASALRDDLFGPIDSTVSRSIALHDSGWSLEDAAQIQELRANPKAQPRSFLQASTDEFLRAWVSSIDTAEKFAPLGGYIVSRHFERLSQRSDANDKSKLQGFRQREKARQARLRSDLQAEEAALEKLVDALQFCDLLSLYLCSGSKRSVKFEAPEMVLRRSGDEHRLDPFPFREHRQFSFSALKHPAGSGKAGQSGATFYINF